MYLARNVSNVFLQINGYIKKKIKEIVATLKKSISLIQSSLYITATLGTWGTGRLIQDH